MVYIVTDSATRLVELNSCLPSMCTTEVIYQGTSMEKAVDHAIKVPGTRVYTFDGDNLTCNEADSIMRRIGAM